MLVDYSTARPSMHVLKKHDVTAVGRYIGWDSVSGYRSIGKNITKKEADELLAHDIEIFLFFEYAPNAAVNGAQQGTADGALADVQLGALGAPDNVAVYFAVDFDLPDYVPSLSDDPANALLKLGPVAHYFEAINHVRRNYEVGVYGGYYAVKRVLDAKLATKACQTLAWSGGKVDSRIDIYQNGGTPPFAGADVDVREHAATRPDFGQWSPVRKPTPQPTPQPPAAKSISIGVPPGTTRIDLTFVS